MTSEQARASVASIIVAPEAVRRSEESIREEKRMWGVREVNVTS